MCLRQGHGEWHPRSCCEDLGDVSGRFQTRRCSQVAAKRGGSLISGTSRFNSQQLYLFQVQRCLQGRFRSLGTQQLPPLSKACGDTSLGDRRSPRRSHHSGGCRSPAKPRGAPAGSWHRASPLLRKGRDLPKAPFPPGCSSPGVPTTAHPHLVFAPFHGERTTASVRRRDRAMGKQRPHKAGC